MEWADECSADGSDLSQSPAPIVDKRTKQLRQQMFTEPGVYVFFHEKLYNQLKSYVANDATAVLYDQVGTVDDPKRLFIVDCPDVVSDLKGVLQKCHPDFTILYLFKKRPVSKWG
ncbi:single-stranded-DNA-specific exonuclease C-terminal domain-containing protein, partial [Lentilactobacillus parafarraginis]|uniref:single-stranded-DNA-specific exonuclease C-terminal domain-containing protein n=1 Tax=Lentilactobacillus parafarraginis TaxID=390842 RepID=UPI000B1954D2